MNFADCVRPEEMTDCQVWLDQALAALRDPASVAAAAAAEVRLVGQGWGSLVNGLSVSGRGLCLQGTTYAAGLGTHAESEIVVRLPAPGAKLTGLAGVDDNPDTRPNAKALTFSVEAGGREIWRGAPQTVTSPPARVAADLGGQREFTLRVRGPVAYGHADWVNLQVTLADGRTLNIGQPPRQGSCVQFSYDGTPWSALAAGWSFSERELPGTADYAARLLTRTDPQSGLQIEVEFKQYRQFPAVEWQGCLRHTGNTDSAIIADVQSLAAVLPPDPVLHYHTGDYCAADGYEPHTAPLRSGTDLRFAPDGGRPTNRAWPYYNIEWPSQQRGTFAVVGWSGQWASRFRGLADHVTVTAGQELTHFKLHPGETVRTPLSVLLFWRGDRLHAHNLWRRWMLACNLPRPGGTLPEPMLPAYTGRWFAEMAEATEETQIAFFERYRAAGIKLDYWWMDAGWYPCDGQWWRVGTWEPDPKRFPRGLRAVCNYVHRKGTKTLVWFEPERVHPNTWLYNERPQWLLSTTPRPTGLDTPAAHHEWWRTAKLDENKLLDLGNPEALTWLIEHTSRTLVEQGIDLYRQDFNFEPLPYWRANDAPDRQGITEIRYVEGYLTYWRTLRERFPNMLIDSCASGGRRNDLETMRLSVPLHKTDYDYGDLPTKQAFHHSLSLWLPYYGAYILQVDTVDTYTVRSAYASMMLLTYDMRRNDLDTKLLRRLCAEWRQVAPFFLGDYYPLTPFNRSHGEWIAWQFHDPEKNAGLVQAFRRSASPFTAACFRLHALEEGATYQITDFDHPRRTCTLTGKELLENGLPVNMTEAPQAVVFIYRKQAS